MSTSLKQRRPIAVAAREIVRSVFTGKRTKDVPAFSEDDVQASILRDSFFEFVKYFWHTVIPEEPHWNWHIEYLCDELQAVAERVFRNEPSPYDLIINISPGSTKSTIASVMFPAWVWIRMASARMICGSYSHQLSIDLSRKCRDIVTSDEYRRLFPEIALRDDQNAKSYFMNKKGGLRFATSTGGTVTGFHGHFLLIDDPMDPNAAASMTEADLKAANTWMSETLPSRKVNNKIVPTIIIMQRLHQNDPTGNRLEKAGTNPVRHISLPADCTEYEVQPPELKGFYVNGLMDPQRLPREVLKEKAVLLGDFGYAGQYGQSPVPRGGGMFKIGRVEICARDLKEQMGKCRQVVRYWDKAGTADGGAYTVGVLMGEVPLTKDISEFWVLDVIRFQKESSEREKEIVAAAARDSRKARVGVEQEPGSAGKESAENTAKRLAGYRVFLDKVTGDKETRADTFSVQVNLGNVKLLKAPWNAAYLDEMKFFPFSTYKDQIDASSGAFNMLVKRRVKVGAL